MSDSDCSNCEKDCPCRDNSYNCWVICANDLKEKLTLESVGKIRDIVADLESIKDECRAEEVSMAIHPLRTILELYEEIETET